MNEPKKGWYFYYEKAIDNILKILWLILLITWIVTEHRL
jgi:hypothetical protein